MKLCQRCLVCAVVLTVSAGPTAAQSEEDSELLGEVREIRARLEALEAQHAREREEYQRTIRELRAEMETLKGGRVPDSPVVREDVIVEEEDLESILGKLRAADTGVRQEPALVESVGRAFQNFNPQISLNADFVGHYSSNEGGEFDDEFLFRHLELGFAGNIDPYTRADVYIGLGRHDNEWHVHLEEAYLTYLGLPWDLQVRAGRFKSTFGRANPQHLHALPWVEHPLVIQNYFGTEGLSGDGVGVSWLVPNRWDKYIELTYEIINNDSALFAGRETDDFVHLAHVKGFLDLSAAATLEAGFTLATAPNDEGHGGNRTTVEGFDLTYKWRPPEAGHYRSFLWQTEVLAAQADLQGGEETTWGMYTAADYQFARRWALGARYDYSQMPYSSSMHEHGYSAYLTFLQSEFLYWRLGYQYTDRNFHVHDDRQEHEVFLQCNFNLGAHPAHRY